MKEIKKRRFRASFKKLIDYKQNFLFHVAPTASLNICICIADRLSVANHFHRAMI